MTVPQMQYFLATAEYGSFSQTAKVFYTTQPTISRQIQLLEDELGYALFIRNAKPLKLTAAGKVFYESLKPILQSIDDMKKKSALAAQGRYGFIRLSFQTGLNIEEHYEELLKNIHATIPTLQISYQKTDLSLIKETLLSQKTDMALALHTKAIESDFLNFDDLCQLQSFVLVGTGHPLYVKDRLSENDLLNSHIYLSAPLSGYSIHQGMLGGFYINREHILEVDNIPTALINTRFSNGVTIINDFMKIKSSPGVFKVFPVLDNSHNPYISIVTRKDCRNPAVPVFSDLIKNYHP